MPTSPEGMYWAVLRNLKDKTGKDTSEWLALVQAQVQARGPMTSSQIRDWLRHEHGLGHSTASILANEATKPADYVEPTAEELIAKQYAGEKAALKPIYDALAALVRELGPDAKLDPRNTYVSLVRRRQFGLIQPTTKTRVDLGLILPATEAAGRLQVAGSWGSGRTTHRIAFTAPGEVDAAVAGWLRAAYEQGA